jgi:hypothetical protein
VTHYRGVVFCWCACRIRHGNQEEAHHQRTRTRTGARVANARRACILEPELRQGEDATRRQTLLKKEAKLLREPVGVPAGDPAAQCHPQRSCCLEAKGRGHAGGGDLNRDTVDEPLIRVRHIRGSEPDRAHTRRGSPLVLCAPLLPAGDSSHISLRVALPATQWQNSV